MKKISLLCLVALLAVSCDKSITDFQSKNFIKFFGSGNGSNGASIIELPGEGYMFTGYDKNSSDINQINIVKTDLNGNTVWENVYENPNDSIQEGLIIKKFDEENFIIVGNTQASESDYVNPVIIKVNKYGELQWKKRLPENYDLIINDFTVTEDKLFLVGEMYKASATLPDTYIASLNSSGEVIDTVTNNHGVRSDTFNKIFVNEQGNLVVVGNTNSSLGGSITTVTVSEFRTNSLYIPSNYVEISTTSDQILSNAIFTNNQLHLLVYESNSGTRVISLNSDYSVLWQTELVSQIQGKSITLTSNGTLYFAGNNASNIQLVKVDSEGNVYFGEEIFKTYPGLVNNMLGTNDNGLILVGATTSGYGNMVQLIKTDSDLYLFKP